MLSDSFPAGLMFLRTVSTLPGYVLMFLPGVFLFLCVGSGEVRRTFNTTLALGRRCYSIARLARSIDRPLDQPRSFGCFHELPDIRDPVCPLRWDQQRR